jgi:hypothetical protein
LCTERARMGTLGTFLFEGKSQATSKSKAADRSVRSTRYGGECLDIFVDGVGGVGIFRLHAITGVAADCVPLKMTEF